jgi:CheY-like chemotaxis protein
MRLQDKVIFVIEDDVSNLAVISTILKREGARTQFDRWGLETVERIQQLGHVDLILCDLMLPHGASGYKVLELIRAVPALAEIPVVAVTASDPAVELAKVQAAGFKSFIRKPISRRKFGDQLVAILNGEEIWATDDDYSHF